MSSNVHMTNNNMNQTNSHINNINSNHNHMNVSRQSNQNNMNNSKIINNKYKNNNNQGKKLKEKINIYSFTEGNNLNTTSKKDKNMKKTVKCLPNPKERKKTLINKGKLKISNNSLNKTGLISKINNKERNKIPSELNKMDSNYNHGKISKKIQEIKKSFLLKIVIIFLKFQITIQ